MKDKAVGIIPALNEERKIGEVVREALNYVDSVIVIDDGSTDDTYEEARKAGAYVLRHDTNKGKGVALQNGLEYALKLPYGYFILLDADGQHDPSEIPILLNPLKEYDVVLGVRDFKKMPRSNWISNTLSRFFTNYITGLKINDAQCGYRAMRRKALENLNLRTSRFEVEHELLVHHAKNKHKIKEVPVRTIYADEVSSVKALRDIINYIKFASQEIIKNKF